MAQWLEALGLFLRPPDLRSRREVDDEIRAELEFHLESRTEELERDGMAADEARREAQRRFGDRAHVEKACRQAQIGERIMLQRIQAGLLVVLVGVVGWLAWQNQRSDRASAATLSAMARRLDDVTHALDARNAAREVLADPAEDVSLPLGPNQNIFVPSRDLLDLVAGGAVEKIWEESTWRTRDAALHALEEQWLAKLNADSEWRLGLEVGNEVARLPADDALAALTTMWPRVLSAQQRRQLLKPFAMRELHARALPILDLAANDPDLEVQATAFTYLRSIALRDFAMDHAAYAPWYARCGALPIGDVLVISARDLARRIRDADGATVARAIEQLSTNRLVAGAPRDAVARTLREEGMQNVVFHWMESDDALLAQAAPAWIALMQVDFQIVRGWLEVGGTFRASALDALRDDRYALGDEELRWMLRSRDDSVERIALWRLGRQPLSRDLFESDIALRLADLSALDRGDVESLTNALGRRECAFAVDALTRVLLECDPQRGFQPLVATALGAIGDARAIPPLIAAVAALGDEPRAAAEIGANGLTPLTGVRTTDARDATYWTRWWEENRARLPEEVRERPLPRVAWAKRK